MLRISLVHQFEQHKDETYRVCFSPDGNTLWSSDGTAIYQWQRSLGDSWNYCQQLPGGAFDLQCTADGKIIVFRDREKNIRFLSYDGKELMALSHPDQGIVTDFTVSPDQHWLVRDGKTGNILLYDLLKHEWTSIGVPDQPDTSDGTVGCLRFAWVAWDWSLLPPTMRDRSISAISIQNTIVMPFGGFFPYLAFKG